MSTYQPAIILICCFLANALSESHHEAYLANQRIRVAHMNYILFHTRNRAYYYRLQDEGIVVNAIGMSLVALAILMIYILQRDEFRFRAHILIRSGDL